MTYLAAGGLQSSEIMHVLLALAVLLGLARLLGEIARKLKQPAVLGEILAGVILGATVLGNPALLGPDGANVQFYHWLFPEFKTTATGEPIYEQTLPSHQEPTQEPVTPVHPIRTPPEVGETAQPAKVYSPTYLATMMFINLAAVFLLLVAGLEVDLSIVWRQGKAALLVSLTGVVVPFTAGFGMAYLIPTVIGFDPDSDQLMPFALFIGIAMSITALPVIAKILMDMNMFRSDMGMIIMSSAMVNDLVGWIGFAIVLAVMGSQTAGVTTPGDGSGLIMTVGLTLLFVGGMLTLGRWMSNKALPFIQAHTSWPGGVLGFVLVVALTCAAATEAIGIHAIFGAFIAGIAIGDSRHLREKTRENIEQFITYVFAPIFFAGIGLRVNFVAHFDLVMVLLVLGVAIAGKVFGCYMGAKWAGLSRRQSWAVGFGMSARGAMEIILGQIALNHGLITEELFVAIVIMAIVTSLMAGPAMQAVLREKKHRHLGDMLSDKSFAGQLKATTHRDAVRELAKYAAEQLGLDEQKLDSDIWRREDLASTGLPNALAVPHARVEGLKKPIIIVAQSNAGIDFDASDGRLAEVICLVLTPVEDSDSQLDMLRAIGEAFHENPSAHRQCLGAANLTELKAALMTTVVKREH